MAIAAPPDLHVVTLYARDVVAGDVAAGYLVRLACQRHLDDLEHGAERGLRFDEEAADKALKFFGFLRLAEGEHAGKPFTLQSWQVFVVGSLFGWKRRDGNRRFRTSYAEIGKGNGKSPMAGGIGLYLLVADGEAGAEIYSAATTRDQAKILFRDAENMVDASPALSARIDKSVGNLACAATNSFFRPVSSEHRGLDGKRVHGALIDELHEHASSIVADKMRAGTKGRRQALIFEITNSGYDRHSVCWQHHEYSRQVLEGSLQNDSWFAYVCGLDPCDACFAQGLRQPKDGCSDCDDWRDEAVWIKANPNLGVSITHTYLREQVDEAIGMPSKQNIVKRLSFCVWTEQVTRWLQLDAWDECGMVPVRAELLTGRRCYAGLDLASTGDLTALVLVFPDDERDGLDLLAWFWCPSEGIRQRSNAGVPYDQWVSQGLIEATEGNVVDYDVIEAKIKDLADTFDLAESAYDRWNSTQLVTNLVRDGATMVPFGQGFASMSAPSKELERLVTGKKLRHGGNPVLRWMASNVAIAQDPAGNIKPDREHSSEKIDGVVAAVMAIGRAMAHADMGRSRYEDESLFFLDEEN